MAFYKSNGMLILTAWFIAIIPVTPSVGLQTQQAQPDEKSAPAQTQPVEARGRIIDSQGMGVAGAELQLLNFQVGGVTLPVPAKSKTDQLRSLTDDQGWFKFPGITQSSVRQIKVTGQGIVPATLTAQDLKNASPDGIVLVAQPARSITGTVVDRTSKKPISNVALTLRDGGTQIEVDQSGKFELNGLPAFQPLVILANPLGDEAYQSIGVPVPVGQGFDKTKLNIELERGVWVNCNVHDFVTSQPAKAQIFYFPTPENKQFQSFAESFFSRGASPSKPTDSSGNAKIVAVPGPGVIVLVATGFPADNSVNKLSAQQRAMLNQFAGPELTAVQWIDPKNLDDEIELSFVVSKGRTIEIELAGKQLDAADQFVVHRAASKNASAKTIQGPKFVAEQFHPDESRQVLIHGPQQRLGTVLNLKADAKSPVAVTLDPTGSVMGQLVDKTGTPQPGLLVKFEIEIGETGEGRIEAASPTFTDANGRFEKPSLIATLDYRLSAIRPTKNQQMMMDSPAVDSRWPLVDALKINSNEIVDLGSIVLGSSEQPEPKRKLQKETVTKNNSLPRLISGAITSETGKPIGNATITFNTWPNRSGDLLEDSKLTPSVLAQAVSDASGNFQLSIGANLEEKLIASNDGETNAALVVVAEKRGSIQVPISEITDPLEIQLKMNREMVVRGRIIASEGLDVERVRLICDSEILIYDVETLEKLITSLKEGNSLESTQRTLEPDSRIDPSAGGSRMAWETSSSGTFLIRNIPINGVFKVHAIAESGQQETFLVVSRPMPGFEFKPSEDSTEQMQLQGSRVKLNFGSDEANKN